jgi:hypothetical protein
MALLDSLISSLTRSPGDVAKEQFKKLYLRLYPYIVGDFYHKGDMDAAMATVLAELQETKAILQLHIHPVTGVSTGPSAFPVFPVSPTVKPTPTIGESLIVRGGVPQPTGAGISFQESRIDPNPLAIPPINPLDPSV